MDSLNSGRPLIQYYIHAQKLEGYLSLRHFEFDSGSQVHNTFLLVALNPDEFNPA